MENNQLIYSRKHFLIGSIVGGSLFGAFTVASNFWVQKKKFGNFLTMFLGLIANILMELFLYGIFLITLDGTDFYTEHFPWTLIVFFFSGQTIFSLLTLLLFKIKKLKRKAFPGGHVYFSKRRLIYLILLGLIYAIMHNFIPMIESFFPNMIIILFVLPHFYFYVRASSVFTGKWSTFARHLVVILPLVTFIPYTLRGFLTPETMRIPYLVGDFYMISLIYLFLLILFIDLGASILLRLRALPTTIIRNSKVRLAAFVSIIVTLVVVMGIGIQRHDNIQVNSYTIKVPKKDATLDSLKIAFIADMHLSVNTTDAFIDDYVGKINEIAPDIVLYGGDNVENSRISSEKLEELLNKLAQCKTNYGQFAVGGNHDNHRLSFYSKPFETQVLVDTVVKVADSFYILGLRYRNNMETKPIREIMEQATENLPVFQLDHSPYQLEAAYNNNIDIQLSGHTHNGQLWPINFVTDLMYELPWGYKKIENTHFFVTSGIQGWGVPVRTSGISEIMVINVEFN